MSVTIDILGSCVTRDAFAFIKNDYKLNSYHPRASLISIYAPPIDIKKEGIPLKSEYQQRLIFFDFTKKFFNHIKETNADVLVIDFMDERMGVLKFMDTYITHSDELKQSNLKKLFNTQMLDFDSDYMELWETSALKFIHDVNKRPFKKVIIHKALYMNTYIDTSGNKVPFTEPKRLERIQTKNALLQHMYQFIEKNLQNVHVIEPSSFSADENHKWGLTPFHYEKAYYQYFMEELNDTISKS